MTDIADEISQQFLQEIINDLPDDRVSMDEECIRVTGSSGTSYLIRLNGAVPFMVFRESEGELFPIDLVPSNPLLPLGDILASLTLALFSDLDFHEERPGILSHLMERGEEE